MGGASANHAPAVSPIITEDSNPLSNSTPPSLPTLQEQATITREDHLDLWAEQAPTLLHQSSHKTRTFCRTMQPSCVLPCSLVFQESYSRREGDSRHLGHHYHRVLKTAISKDGLYVASARSFLSLLICQLDVSIRNYVEFLRESP